MTTWSTRGIPTKRETRSRRRVTSRSSGLGSGSPLGWLWATTIAAAESRIAGRKTSLGWTRLVFRVPSEMRSRPIIRCLPSRSRATKRSFCRPRIPGLRCRKTASADCIEGLGCLRAPSTRRPRAKAAAKHRPSSRVTPNVLTRSRQDAAEAPAKSRSRSPNPARPDSP